jgi:hypothetical protein
MLKKFSSLLLAVLMLLFLSKPCFSVETYNIDGKLDVKTQTADDKIQYDQYLEWKKDVKSTRDNGKFMKFLGVICLCFALGIHGSSQKNEADNYSLALGVGFSIGLFKGSKEIALKVKKIEKQGEEKGWIFLNHSRYYAPGRKKSVAG